MRGACIAFLVLIGPTLGAEPPGPHTVLKPLMPAAT